MAKSVLRSVTVFVVTVLLVVAVVYALNFWLWVYAAPKPYLSRISLTQNDGLFLEGIFLIFLGILFMLGRGGIDMWSLKAAVLGATADALYGGKGQKTPGPSDIMRRDVWKALGFIRTALILIFAGVILIVLYFVL